MARNPNLVPTVVTDVNGKTTTVHKKPHGTSASPSKMPAPNVAAYDHSTRVITLLEKHLPLAPNKKRDLWRDLRTTYSIEAMQRMEAALLDDGAIGVAVASQLVNGTHGWLIDATLRYYPKLGIEDYDRVTRLVFSLSGYEGTKKNPTEYVEQGYIDLMTLTHHLDNMIELENFDRLNPLEYNSHGDNWSAAIIKNKALVQYVMTNHQDMEALASEIVKYGVTDPTTIIGIREGIHPAIAEGNL